MLTQQDLARLCRRFEIVVGNFGRSCASMKANERAFQAWYAATLCQEFGFARVYRELHLWKSDLFELAGSEGFYSHLEKGSELFPDVAVAWQPEVDARHSSTRSDELKYAGDLLLKFGLVSEFKVTGSTGKPTPFAQVERDLAKLG